MEKIILKKIITHENKNLLIPILTGAFLALYTICGAISNQNAQFLEFLSLEDAIPLMPWTIWIYIVLYPLYLIWILYSYRDITQMNKTMYGFIVLTLISCAIFLFFPISYPRNNFPLPKLNNLSITIFELMREADKPSNCLPSLHVGLCYLFAFGLRFQSQKKYFISLFISTLVAVSTLTTKQHYLYDIVTGFILAYGIDQFFLKKVEIDTQMPLKALS